MTIARETMRIYPTASGCAGEPLVLRPICLLDCHEILFTPILTAGEFLTEPLRKVLTTRKNSVQKRGILQCEHRWSCEPVHIPAT